MTNLKYLFVFLLTILCPFASLAEDYKITFENGTYIGAWIPNISVGKNSKIMIPQIELAFNQSKNNGYLSFIIQSRGYDFTKFQSIIRRIIANDNDLSLPLIITLSNGKTISTNSFLMMTEDNIRGFVEHPDGPAYARFFMGVLDEGCNFSGENVPASYTTSRFFTLLRSYDIISLTIDDLFLDLSGLNSAYHINAILNEIAQKGGYVNNMGKKELATAPKVTKGTINGHEYVDLGLPSGTKWATCNLGASSPEQYGSYFAWGETRPKTSYTNENSEIYNKDMSWLRNNGYIDGNRNLTLSHDAARQNWGGTWRIPSEKDIKELFEYTRTQWTMLNGVYGRLIKSDINGESIFLPAAGFIEGTTISHDLYDSYWISTLSIDPHVAFCLYFAPDDYFMDGSAVSCGQSIRPISD